MTNPVPDDRTRWRRVSFTTEDHITLFADYAAPAQPAENKAPMAILLHMYKSDRGAWAPLMGPLQRAGFAVLAVDLRGHGESVGPADMRLAERVNARDANLFAQMDKDVAAAYLWLRDQPGVDPARFVLIGASVGCSIALDYAARDRSVDGVIALTPGTNYLGIDAVAAVRAYGNRPLLLVCAKSECEAADQLTALAPQATVSSYPDVTGGDPMSLHGTRMFGKVRDLEDALVKFALQAARAPSRNPVVISTRGKTYYAPESNYARHLQPRNLRWLSSAAEAEARGLRPPQSVRNAAGGSGAPSDGTAQPEDQ